ncbi:MAG: histidine kinase dimerization/phosphoacceptor domain -containing protein [Cyclobacteriaceae bacterium]
MTFYHNYIYGRSWKIINQNDTTTIDSYLNELFLDFEPSEELQVIFIIDEIDRLNGMNISLDFVPANEFEKIKNQENLAQAFFLGIFSFLVIFNLLLYFATKWKVYLKYSAYILSALLYLSYYFGLLQILLPPLQSVSANIISTFYSLIFVLYFWFLNDLGDYKNTVPKADFYLRLGMWYKSIHVLIEIILVSFRLEIVTHPAYKYLFLVFEIALMAMIIYHIMKAKNFRGRVVIAGSLILIIAAIVAQLETGVDRGLILESGILAELLLFSIALGYISRKFYEEKNQTQKLYVEQLEKNNAILENLEEELEAKVEERTLALEQKSEENKMLIYEMHHRVKNNLQMISSMLNMQLRRVESEEAKVIIQEANSRIATIGLIHEHLYQNFDILDINVKKYVEELIQLAIRSITPGRNIKSKNSIQSLSVKLDQALPVGLIINELITNSIKHARTSKSDPLSISISIKKFNSNLEIIYLDNGLISQNPIKKEGLGFSLIKALLETPENLRVNTSSNNFELRIVI